MVTCTVHSSDGIQIGSALKVSGGRWREAAGEDGLAIQLQVADVTAAQMAETTIVRVNDGTSDVFAFVPVQKTHVLVDAATETYETELSGPGVRWLMRAGQVYQEDTSDCAAPADARHIGWQSAAYDDTSWAAPETHGTWRSSPFETARPAEFPAPMAQYLWRTTSYDLGEEEVLFRQTFTLSEDTELVLCIAADDEYEAWLDGTRLPIGTYGSDLLYNWRDYDELPLTLCAGTHTFAVRGRNLPANVAGQNPGWAIWAFCEIAGDGRPAAQNAVWDLDYPAATGGTFTVRPTNLTATATLNWDDTATEAQTTLEALVGSGNVSVSGTVGDLTIEFTGDYANVAVGLWVDDSLLVGDTVDRTETQRGGSASSYAMSNTATVAHYHPTTDEPGLTPGEILRILVQEARDRGVSILDDITFGFTDTLDSDGTPWGFGMSFQLPLPDSIHRVVEILEELGGIDVWMDPDLTLQASQERGSDLALTLTQKTASCANVRASSDESAVSNVIRLRPDTGWAEATDPTSIAARGRWESELILAEHSTQRGAEGAADILLVDVASPQRRTTFQVPAGAPYVPNVDYGIGDRPMAPVFTPGGFTSARVRVDSLDGEIVEDDVDWTVEVVD